MKAHEQAARELEQNGYTFKRHGANHDIYFNPQIGAMISLKRHDFDESDLRYIQKEIRHNARRG